MKSNDQSHEPVVSVITVVRNAAEPLQRTIQSVVGQSYSRIEYLVIDGASTDQTVEVIRQNEHHIHRWISEPDRGIYDAMNKGADLATGDWVLFMNAGDEFYSEHALEDLTTLLSSDADVVLAGAEKVLVDEVGTRKYKIEPRNLDELWKHMPTVHQSVLVRRELQQEYRFNTEYQWCADHDLLLRLKQKGHRFASTAETFCSYDCCGGMARDPMLFIRERSRLSRGAVSLLRRWCFFGAEWLHCRVWGSLVNTVKPFLGHSMLHKLRQIRGTQGV